MVLVRIHLAPQILPTVRHLVAAVGFSEILNIKCLNKKDTGQSKQVLFAVGHRLLLTAMTSV